MRYDDDDLGDIYEKTNGRCHLCRGVIQRSAYGDHGHAKGWEVDHSNPRAKGGTHRRSNLLPACCSCNRSKQAGSTRAARRRNGFTRRPMSRAELDDARTGNTLAGGGLGAVVGGALFGPVGAFLGGMLGGVIGDEIDPET